MATETVPDLPCAHPAVRDLAFLLTSPSPWHCGDELPAWRLLGEDGPARLSRLARDPAPLLAWLADGDGKRLLIRQ
ncbi:hypothetical protein CXB49_03175 [Chromobacterium sp. ATCC 53434]|uniref:hypothetical protein n=1 Tax=Chromobacterium sp. (strain ATCC 53434 / SC 14030) TaxID=2059672 RepID=UPI000C76AE83|nr:hypothetical protein [Chromobacterium sp. ATCC 53434]AUH49904.1 hypothetical protein CXB49_03175 [Chromobacterium sp. ATCC 53434]